MFASDLGDLFSSTCTAVDDTSSCLPTLSTTENGCLSPCSQSTSIARSTKSGALSSRSKNSTSLSIVNAEDPRSLDLVFGPELVSYSASSGLYHQLGQLPTTSFPTSRTSQTHTATPTTVQTSHVFSKIMPQFLSSGSSQSRGSLRCPFCDKQFSNSSAIAKHKLTHSEERRYVCPICQKAFKRQDHLNGHKYTHETKKPHACHFCDKSYSDARSLRRHYENAHPEEYERWLMLSQATNGDTSAIAVAAAALLSSSGLDVDLIASRTASMADTTSVTTSVSLLTALSNPVCKLLASGLSQAAKSEDSPTSGTVNASQASNGRSSRDSQLHEHKSRSVTDWLVSTVSPHSSHSGCYSLSVSPSGTMDTVDHDGANTVCVQVDDKTTTTALSSLSSLTAEDMAAAAKVALLMAHPLEAPKRVACAVCQKRFKNQSALNGHMRLHGGYGPASIDGGSKLTTPHQRQRQSGQDEVQLSSGQFRDCNSTGHTTSSASENKSQNHSVERFINSQEASRANTSLSELSNPQWELSNHSQLEDLLDSSANITCDSTVSAQSAQISCNNQVWADTFVDSDSLLISHRDQSRRTRVPTSVCSTHQQGTAVEQLKKTTSEGSLSVKVAMLSDQNSSHSWWPSNPAALSTSIRKPLATHCSSGGLDSHWPNSQVTLRSSPVTHSSIGEVCQPSKSSLRIQAGEGASTTCSNVTHSALSGSRHVDSLGVGWRGPLVDPIHSSTQLGSKQTIILQHGLTHAPFGSPIVESHRKSQCIASEPFVEPVWSSSSENALRINFLPSHQPQYSPVTPASTTNCMSSCQNDTTCSVFAFPPLESHDLQPRIHHQLTSMPHSAYSDFGLNNLTRTHFGSSISGSLQSHLYSSSYGFTAQPGSDFAHPVGWRNPDLNSHMEYGSRHNRTDPAPHCVESVSDRHPHSFLNNLSASQDFLPRTNTTCTPVSSNQSHLFTRDLPTCTEQQNRTCYPTDGTTCSCRVMRQTHCVPTIHPCPMPPHSEPVLHATDFSPLCVQPYHPHPTIHGRHSFPSDRYANTVPPDLIRPPGHPLCAPHPQSSAYRSLVYSCEPHHHRTRHISAPILLPQTSTVSYASRTIPQISNANSTAWSGRPELYNRSTQSATGFTSPQTSRYSSTVLGLPTSCLTIDDQEVVTDLLMQSHISDPPGPSAYLIKCNSSVSGSHPRTSPDFSSSLQVSDRMLQSQSAPPQSSSSEGARDSTIADSAHSDDINRFELADLTTGGSADESDTSAITRLTKSLADDNLFRNPHTIPPPKKLKRKPAPIFIPPQTGANLSRLRSPRVWTTEASASNSIPPPYTPPPMLSPNRRGSGLFSSLSRWPSTASPARTETFLARRNSSCCSSEISRRRPFIPSSHSVNLTNAEGQLKRSYANCFVSSNAEQARDASEPSCNHTCPHRKRHLTPKSAPILFSDQSVSEMSNMTETSETPVFVAQQHQQSGTVFGYDDETMRRFAEADAAADKARRDRHFNYRRRCDTEQDRFGSHPIEQLHNEVPEKISKLECDMLSSLMNYKADEALELVEDTLAELDEKSCCNEDVEMEEYTVDDEDEGLPSSLIPHINIGEAFQADVPEFCSYRTQELKKDTETRETLLWYPGDLDEKDPKNIESLNLLMKIACSPAVRNCGLNMEYTFHLLCKYKGNLEMTLHALLYETLVVYDYVYAETTAWTTEEIARFQHGLRVYGRDFHHVAKDLQANGMNKTVKACVEFYYVWKRMNTPSDVKWYREKARRQRFTGRNDTSGTKQPHPTSECERNNSTEQPVAVEVHKGSVYNLRNKHVPAFSDCHNPPREQNEEACLTTERLQPVPQSDYSDQPAPFIHHSPNAGEFVAEQPLTSASGLASFPCHLCDRVFPKVKSRNAHMKSHSDRTGRMNHLSSQDD